MSVVNEGPGFAAALFDALPDPVVVIGQDATLLWANRRAEETFGWTLEELRGSGLVRLLHPDDLDTAVMSLASVAGKERGSLVEIRVQERSGTYVWVEIRGAPWVDGPFPGAVVLAVREVTDRRRWELGAGDTRMLAAILDAAPTINLLLDRDGRIQGASRALTRHLHRPLEQTLELPLVTLVDPPDRAAVTRAVAQCDGSGGTHTLEARLLGADGAVVPMSLTFVDLVTDQAVQGIVVAASDISALVEARTELHHLANHDDLTGLPNRANLLRRLAEVLAREPADPHTLIFGDVDGLKAVNDHHGHQAGDALLAEVAARLRGVMRAGDFVARLSGDEFVVMIPTEDPTAIADVQHRIEVALEPPARLSDGTLVRTSMSLGAATTQPGVSAEEVLAVADAAMYTAKRSRARAG